jgi:superfamily II DNA or RNA helicase
VRRIAATAPIVPAAVAKAYFARAILRSPNEPAAQLGSITLLPHQREGAARILRVLAVQGGALLADEVGLGKTYTALAVARHFRNVEVVAPAALRALWHEACSRCAVAADFVSSELLSHRAPPPRSAALVVVDEAHWFRNRATKRYGNLARRCRGASVLLLSATPLHNTPADLAAVLALFLGPRARRLLPNEIAELTVRRDRSLVATGPAFAENAAAPTILPTRWWRGDYDAKVGAALQALEEPVPARGAGVAAALLRLTLLRRLSSSAAALEATLRRMLARALALLDAARAGRYPTARELCAWIVADEAVQLALPGLVGAIPNEVVPFDAIERHIRSLRQILSALGPAQRRDKARAARLAQLLRRFPDDRIVAFSQYQATVAALARVLRRVPGVATLSGKGARIATGAIARRVLLRQFDAAERVIPVHPSMRVHLLLTTDLLSEGVNLHNAKVAVHLDVPWTAARLEQRVGRLSRISSPHREVHVYGFAPPKELERAQRLVARLRAKWAAAQRRFGESALLAQEGLVRHVPPRRERAWSAQLESVRVLLRDWLGELPDELHTPFIAYVGAPRRARPPALALLRTPHCYTLAVCEGGRITTRPSAVLRAARILGPSVDVSQPSASPGNEVLRRFQSYVARKRAEETALPRLGQSAARLLSHIARAANAVTRGRRARALKLANGVRIVLGSLRSAGDHALLEERAALLVKGVNEDALCWLERVHEDLRQAFPRCGDTAQQSDDYAVLGILAAS